MSTWTPNACNTVAKDLQTEPDMQSFLTYARNRVLGIYHKLNGALEPGYISDPLLVGGKKFDMRHSIQLLLLCEVFTSGVRAPICSHDMYIYIHMIHMYDIR